MLANGSTLAYKKASAYITLAGLKEIPEMAIEYEEVENTCLDDAYTQTERGIGTLPELTYKFKYENGSATSPYRVLKALEDSGAVTEFKETLKDGTSTVFSGTVRVSRSGGGVNGVMEFDLIIALKTAPVVTDPSASQGGA